LRQSSFNNAVGSTLDDQNFQAGVSASLTVRSSNNIANCDVIGVSTGICNAHMMMMMMMMMMND